MLSIVGEINDSVLEKSFDYFSQDLKEYKISLYSNGGSIKIGFALYDLIRSKETSIYAYGHCYSAAVIVFLAGSKRYIGKHCELLIHPVESGTEGSILEMESELKRVKSQVNQIKKILLERSSVGYESIVEKWLSKESYIVSERAVEYGLAHELI